MKERKGKKSVHEVMGMEVSRRDFLRTTAVGAAGFAVGSLPFAPFTYGASKPIRIGMIQENTVGATAYGYWLTKAARASVAKLNAEGGIAGRKVELVEYEMTDDAKDASDPKNTATVSHMWTMWTTPYMIKLAVEKSGWNDSRKNADFMKAFNTLKVKAGWAPQGDLVMRENDHQGFHDHYLEEVQPNLSLKVIARVSKEKLMCDATVDLRSKL